MGCSLLILAGHIHAQDFGKLPTEAYRNDGFEKIVYTYDNYGHVTSGTHYFRHEDGEEVWYEVGHSYLYEYHLMPAGYFVLSKEQYSNNWREITSYDSKGMELSFIQEYYDDGEWHFDWGSRAVVDASGIRTGIERFNRDTQQWETVPGWIFDSKGRVLEFYDEWEEDEEWDKKYGKRMSQSKHSGNDVATMAKQMKAKYKNASGAIWYYKQTYEWNAADQIVGYSMSIGADGVTYYSIEYKNIVYVLNGEYVNQYSSQPLGDEIGIWRSEVRQYAWEDYKHLELCFNGNLTYEGTEYVVTTQINQGGNERIQILSKDGAEIFRNVLTFRSNGSWDMIDVGTSPFDGPKDREVIREYDAYGALTLSSEYAYWDEYDEEDIRKEVYVREYNASGYPTKTSSYWWHPEEEIMVDGISETYTAWADSDIRKNAITPTAVVFPNPTTGVFKISNGACPIVNSIVVEIIDVTVRTVYHEPCTENREIDISHLPAGIYFVKIGNEMAKIVKK